MRAVVQRVSNSRVTVDERVTGEVKKGLLVLLGVTHDDNSKDVDYMVDKVTNLRIFEDENDKMNLSLKDIEGEVMAVSQFTLYGDARKGRRPSFSDAARPDVATGEFGAHMMVELTNDGPVTILLESKKAF